MSAADRGAERSAPRFTSLPPAVDGVFREDELMAELARQASGHDETYRLLVRVLLRDPDELALLRATTIEPLITYDEQNDTDLLATLRTFLAHNGSTSETAEEMGLHRHTVGYRLVRVHEVSSLSPYESDGRERLGLGLKAHDILEAERRARR
jgi:DNA-binding PucR family transcriptional regulator